MKRKRRTEISLETSQTVVIRSRRQQVQAWCAECGATVLMVTPEEGAAIVGLSIRKVYQRMEAGRLHFTETGEGVPLVCLNSLGNDTQI